MFETEDEILSVKLSSNLNKMLHTVKVIFKKKFTLLHIDAK